jgi:isoquinoline 1-oxidoreductase beta subunit
LDNPAFEGLSIMSENNPPGHSGLSRREFLAVSVTAGSGLILGIYFADRTAGKEMFPGGTTKPSAYLKIAKDNSITIIVPSSEMGQGVFTALPMILAEELDVAWEDVIVAHAPVNEVYRNPMFNAQGTWGSNSIRGFYEPLRLTGAAARDMLVRTAAARWNVLPETCHTNRGQVIHDETGRRFRYGEIAEQAAVLEPPAEPQLKNPADFRLIGSPAASKDAACKVDGSAVFGTDVQLPDMLHGAVRQSPVFGSEVAGYDKQKALSQPGVHAVVEVSEGLVVVADSYWQARKALDGLNVTFEESPNANVDSQQISAMLHKALRQNGQVVNRLGDTRAAFADAFNTLEAVYETPFLAHATMEPMSCTAHVTDGKCTLWVGVQTPEFVRFAVAGMLNLRPDDVTLNMIFLGGGFGRRGSDDFVKHAVLASKAVGRPVKIIWSREEDMQHDQYRHAATARLKAALGPGGELFALDGRVAMRPLSIIPDPAWYCRGISDQEYAIPNTTLDFVATQYPVPVGAWRSTTYSNNSFALESFIDEIAAAVGQEPYAYRRRLLSKAPRALHTLDLVAEKGGWSQPLPEGHARGLACAQHLGSYAALVAEVSAQAGLLAVHRIVCMADCGVIINPRILDGQIRGSICDGLWSSLYGRITIREGRVQQSNFHDYPLMRTKDMPEIEVHVVSSDAPPGGAGELATPLVAPAIANAVFQLTGNRVRSLPFADHG